jgi:hypothetical protein
MTSTRPDPSRRAFLATTTAAVLARQAGAASPQGVSPARVSTATPFKKGDVIVAATVMDDPNDDHAGTGRLLQYDADLRLKGTLWIKQTNHKLSGLTFGPDKTLYGFAPLNHAVIEVSPDAKEKPLFDFGDRAFSNITFPKDGTILLGEHLTGIKTKSQYVSTQLPLMKGSDKVGDGHVFRFGKDRKPVAEYPTAVHGGMEGYHGVTSSVLTDNDTRLIYISETGNRVMQYDLANRRQLPDLAVFNDDPDAHFVLWMAALPDRSLLVVTGATFLILDAKTGAKKRVYPMESFGWAAASPSINGAFVYAGNFMDGDVAKLRLSDGVVVARANIGEKRSLSGIAQFPG